MAYSASIPAPVQRTPADGIAVGNTVLLNSTGNLNPIVDADEQKGGVHYVEYLEYLQENSARGVSVGRRKLGMLAYVDKQWNNGADAPLGRYYKLEALNGSTATWGLAPFGTTTVTTSNSYVRANIAGRDALVSTPLGAGDIVVVTDASGDTTVSPPLVGGATYVWNGTAFLRFLFPNDTRLNQAHTQNTDTAFVVVLGNTSVVMNTRAVYDHIADTAVHFRINDLNVPGAVDEVYSSQFLNAHFLKKNPQGDPAKFFNELGQVVSVQASITRINGGVASTVF